MDHQQSNKIKISILISTYNRVEELKSCINSILEVDFPKNHYEILVGDGGSTDSTFEFMSNLVKKSEKFPDQLPIIKYFRNNKNLGAMGNRMTSFRVVKGKYMCVLDSDATVPKNWLKNIYNHMEKNKLDASGGLNITNPKEGPILGADVGSNGIIQPCYRKNDPLFISTVNAFFNTRTLRKMGGLDPIMAYGGADMELGIRARLFGAKISGEMNTIVDHTRKPKGEHFRARKNIEKLTYYQLSRHIYLFLKNFEWRFGIIFSLRIFLFKSIQLMGALIKKNLGYIKGYIKAIFWILSNLGTIILNHNKVKRKIKSFKIVKKYYHPKPSLISICVRNYRSIFKKY